METLFLWGAYRCVYRLENLQYVFNQKDLNLWKIRLLEILIYYDMSVLYNLGKSNIVADALGHMPMGSVAHVEDE